MRTLLLLLVLAAPAAAQTPQLAAVRVYMFGDTGRVPAGYGSGVYVAPNQILTNHHVLDGRLMSIDGEHPKSVMIRFVDGHRCWARVQAEDKKLDIALLVIEAHPTITPIDLASSNAVRDSRIHMHGFGYDYEYKDYDTTVGQNIIRDPAFGDSPGCHAISDPDGPWVVLNYLRAIPGDSGGPITQGGDLVGLIFAYGTCYSMGIHVDAIKDFFGDKLTSKVR